MISIGVLAVGAGCQHETREFGSWNLDWDWLKLGQKDDKTEEGEPSADSLHAERFSVAATDHFFHIRILESTGSEECLREIWSYLDESSPMSEDWQMLHRNGIRCGIGQHSDWEIVRDRLESCGTHVKKDMQVVVGSLTPVTVLADEYRKERTLFYYTLDGRVRGRDFGPSSLELALVSAGRMPGGRFRLIFSPKILQPLRRIGTLETESPHQKEMEQELEHFSVTLDVGPQEFALVGPGGSRAVRSLIGSQLFSQWGEGQEQTSYILISPQTFESRDKASRKK